MSQDSISLSSLLAIPHEQLLHDCQPLVNYVNDTDEYVEQEFGSRIIYKTELVEKEYSAIPQSIPGVLSNEEYPGPLNFEVVLDPHGTKNPWVFSKTLNKIYISANTTFPVDFKWSYSEDMLLYVRATPIFALPQYSRELVVRCAAHSQKTDASNVGIPEHMWHHVIRCLNPKANYQGDIDSQIHLNVLIPLSKPQSGTDCVREMYQFVCKNSCPSGMNRRPLEVIFTLENDRGEVLGRKVLSVRVCSCPKRDKEKEEKENNRDIPVNGKKRKRVQNNVDTTLDTKEYTVNLPIIGKNNYIKVMQYAGDLMAGEILRHGPAAEAPFKKCLNNINNLMHQAN